MDEGQVPAMDNQRPRMKYVQVGKALPVLYQKATPWVTVFIARGHTERIVLAEQYLQREDLPSDR